MRWIIYYGDGSEFTSDDGTPADAPAENIQIIAQNDIEVGRELLSMFDFYRYDPIQEKWIGHDIHGLLTYFRMSGVVKQAVTLPNRVYRELLSRAASDDRLKPKSARYRHEEQY